ncbi:hypothetical protein JTB14_022566 [Gonioctena quinquepunctata]|nr:hypothetical protein JTB14_022566 [Gonioctena quinquepunctata]
MKNFAAYFLVALVGCVLAFPEHDRNEHLGDWISDQLNNSINAAVKNLSEPMKVDDVKLQFNESSMR